MRSGRGTQLLALAGLLITPLILGIILQRSSSDGIPSRAHTKPLARQPTVPELSLSDEPPPGRYEDPAAGAEWEDEQRRKGVALAALPGRGTLRCYLRPAGREANDGLPSVELVVTNPTSARVSVTVHGHRALLDLVSFVLRGPSGEIEGASNPGSMRSAFFSAWERVSREVGLGPGEQQSGVFLLSSAVDRGFRHLQPGVYTLEAVFVAVPDSDGGYQIVARSDRLPIRVGRP